MEIIRSVKTGNPTAVKALLEALKHRLLEQGLPLAALDAHGGEITRNVNRIAEGNPKPNARNMGTIAEAIFELLRRPPDIADPKIRERVAKFWKRFCEDLQRLAPRALGEIRDSDGLKSAFYLILGLVPDDPASRAFAEQVHKPQTQIDNSSTNPFTWRTAIRDRSAFFGRMNELRRLRDAIRNGQHYQIIGPRRIGKSSLLLAVWHRLKEWLVHPSDAARNLRESPETRWPGKGVVAYVDMQDAACHTQTRWLRQVARDWGWSRAPTDQTEFSERVKALKKDGLRPVLCVDECEKFIGLEAEFPLPFFENLRSLGQQGLSIFTASTISLRELRQRSGLLSPYYNTFPPMYLEPFAEDEARAFVTLARPGVPPFSEREKTSILAFALGHPLKLQIACCHVFEARLSGEPLNAALLKAQREAEQLLPQPNV